CARRLGSDYRAKELPELRDEVFDCVKDCQEGKVG
ncbi:Serine O-acetyltransferase, partial [Pseudomonas syringae pv. japonica str. M301072]